MGRPTVGRYGTPGGPGAVKAAYGTPQFSRLRTAQNAAA
jgi:hypothetical protein